MKNVGPKYTISRIDLSSNKVNNEIKTLVSNQLNKFVEY